MGAGALRLAPFLFMRLELASPCKINLVLNILGRRADGFHELETVMYPVNVCDQIVLEEAPAGIDFSCDDPRLPADDNNLVVRAARAFLAAAPVRGGCEYSLRSGFRSRLVWAGAAGMRRRLCLA
ncbi:MAG: hypothetical protein M5U12_16925 [Verrucomicrobia bacterium]|nr:hypothetical protein [Verrucomicrobiota bacterium]